MIIKLLKDKDRILKAVRTKRLVTYKGSSIRLTVDFSAKKPWRPEDSGMTNLKCWKDKTLIRKYSGWQNCSSKMRKESRYSQINKSKRLHYHYMCATRNAKRSPSGWNKKMFLDSNLKPYEDIKISRGLKCSAIYFMWKWIKLPPYYQTNARYNLELQWVNQ